MYAGRSPPAYTDSSETTRDGRPVFPTGGLAALRLIPRGLSPSGDCDAQLNHEHLDWPLDFDPGQVRHPRAAPPIVIEACPSRGRCRCVPGTTPCRRRWHDAAHSCRPVRRAAGRLRRRARRRPWDGRVMRAPTQARTRFGAPPCQRWGRFWHGSTRKPHQYKLGDDGGCFKGCAASRIAAMAVSRTSAHSKAWDAFGIMKPTAGAGWQRPRPGRLGLLR